MLAARLRAYHPNGLPLRQMPKPLSWDAMVVRNDLGSLTLTYSSVAAGGEVVQRALADGVEIALELTDGATDAFGITQWVEPRGCRFIMLDRDSDIADPTKSISLTLPSIGWLLSKARNYTTDVYPPEHAQAGKRGWESPTAGLILANLIDENVGRFGTAQAVQPVFAASVDSAGDPWPELPDQAFDLGNDYASIIDALTEAGAIDWQTQARGLYAWIPDSPALSPDLTTGDNPVTLRPKHVAGMPTRESIADMVGRIFVRTDAGGVAIAEDPATPNPWGIPEGFLQVGSVANQAAAVAVGHAELERVGHVRGQYTRELVLTPDAPAPFLDYWPGCWIKGPGAGGALERLRVQSLTLSHGKDGLGGTVVLNDRVLADDERRARKLAALAGSGTISPGGPPTPIAIDPEASRVPSTPTGFSALADLYFDAGVPRGRVTASWDAVSTATDTGALAIAGYELQWRVGSGPWQTITTPELSAELPPLTPGDDVGTRVRAVGARTTLPSAWTAVDTVTVPGDVTAPQAPSTPTATCRLGVVMVAWDGLPAAGVWPDDLARVEIAVGPTLDPPPTEVVGSLTDAGAYPVTGQAYGEDRYFRLRAVDTTGNEGDWSAVSLPVTVVGVQGPDLEANSVTANAIQAGAIDGMVITGPVIRTDPGGDRLELSGSSFKAFVDSNLAMELRPEGLWGYDSAGNLAFRFSAYTGMADMAFVTFMQILNLKTDGIELYTGSGGGGGVGTSSGHLSGSGGVLTLLSEANLDLRNHNAPSGKVEVVAGKEDTGTFLARSNTVSLVAGNVAGGLPADHSRLDMRADRAVLTSAGSVGFRHLTLDLEAGVTTAGSTGDAYTFIANDRGVYLGHATTGQTANTWISSTDGRVYRSTSSLRYKVDVTDLDTPLSLVRAMRPIRFRDRREAEEDPNTERWFPGFIAEEFDALGLDLFVEYAPDDEGNLIPEAIRYDRISAAQHLLLLAHDERLATVEARLATLEAA